MGNAKRVGNLIIVVILIILAIIDIIFLFGNSSKTFYTVSFLDNDNIESVKVQKGKLVNEKLAIGMDGYDFNGWFLNDDLFDFNTKVYNNITLVAKYSETKYKISFVTGTIEEIKNQELKKGEKITKPADPVKEGSIFKYWSYNGFEYDFNKEVTSNMKLVAVYDKPLTKYTVTFDSNGGTSVETQIIEENSLLEKPSDPTRSGYRFSDWLYNNKTFDFNTKITKNLTLIAKWTKVSTSTAPSKPTTPVTPSTPIVKQYTLSYDNNGGSGCTSSKYITNGSTYGSLCTPTNTGYRFYCWKDSNGNIVTSTTLVNTTSNVVLQANWIANVYEVVINKDNGISNVYVTNPVSKSNANNKVVLRYNYNTEIEFLAVTENNYTFNYWSGYKSSSESKLSFRMPAQNIELTVTSTLNDNVAPTCSLVPNSSRIQITCSDNVGYSSCYVDNNSLTTGTHTGYVTDNAGNSATCSIKLANTTATTVRQTCAKAFGEGWLINYPNNYKCYYSYNYIASQNCYGNPGSYGCDGYRDFSEYNYTDYTCPSGYNKLNDTWCYK